MKHALRQDRGVRKMLWANPKFMGDDETKLFPFLPLMELKILLGGEQLC